MDPIHCSLMSTSTETTCCSDGDQEVSLNPGDVKGKVDPEWSGELQSHCPRVNNLGDGEQAQKKTGSELPVFNTQAGLENTPVSTGVNRMTTDKFVRLLKLTIFCR